jgi:hypothetical protein
MGVKAGLAALLVAGAASAQTSVDVKETCPQASERAQRLLDDRRMLEARTAFLSCAQDSCPAAVRRDCRAQLDELKKTLPSIVIHVQGSDHSDIAHGVVTLDGTKIGELDGRVLEVDPGTHKVHVELPDGRLFDRQVIVAAGEQSRAVTFDANAPSLGEGVPDVKFEHKPEVPSGGWSTVKILGLSGMIVGGVGLVFGGLFLAVDISNVSTAGTSNPNDCPSPNDPTSTCVKALSAVKNLDVPLMLTGFTVGTVFLATGIVMFVLGGSKHASSSWNVAPMVGPHVAGASFGVSF